MLSLSGCPPVVTRVLFALLGVCLNAVDGGGDALSHKSRAFIRAPWKVYTTAEDERQSHQGSRIMNVRRYV